jgi:hypothetical protein
MKFREHPLVTYHGMRMWPPIWVWAGGKNDKPIEGEAGILREVRLSDVANGRLFLIINYEGSDYMSWLQFDDPSCCHQVYELMHSCVGLKIQQIGDLDVTFFNTQNL